jgi:hypothetical protein
MFVRFVTERSVDLGGAREGIFQAASSMLDDIESYSSFQAELLPLWQWFKDNLSRPSRFGRTASKGHFRRDSAGLSWFKPSATEYVERAIQMSDVLKRGGYPITMLKTRKPGFIVYEDKWQIVAEPFADTPK